MYIAFMFKSSVVCSFFPLSPLLSQGEERKEKNKIHTDAIDWLQGVRKYILY